MSDVTTNEKLMNVGGLKTTVLVPMRYSSRKDGQRVCVFHVFEQNFATSVQRVRFCRQLQTGKHEWIAGVSASLPSRCALHFVLSQRGCL